MDEKILNIKNLSANLHKHKWDDLYSRTVLALCFGEEKGKTIIQKEGLFLCADYQGF